MLATNNEATPYEVLHLSRKIILANLKIWRGKVQTFSGNQRQDRRACLSHVSIVLRVPRETHLCRSFSRCTATKPGRSAQFDKIHRACHKKMPLERQQVFRMWFLTSKCASRHKSVRFSSTSQLPEVFFPTLRCFVHFDFEICFATVACTFRQLSFQKCFENLPVETCFAPHPCAIFYFLSDQMAPHPPL